MIESSGRAHRGHQVRFNVGIVWKFGGWRHIVGLHRWFKYGVWRGIDCMEMLRTSVMCTCTMAFHFRHNSLLVKNVGQRIIYRGYGSGAHQNRRLLRAIKFSSYSEMIFK